MLGTSYCTFPRGSDDRPRRPPKRMDLAHKTRLRRGLVHTYYTGG